MVQRSNSHLREHIINCTKYPEMTTVIINSVVKYENTMILLHVWSCNMCCHGWKYCGNFVTYFSCNIKECRMWQSKKPELRRYTSLIGGILVKYMYEFIYLYSIQNNLWYVIWYVVLLFSIFCYILIVWLLYITQWQW